MMTSSKAASLLGRSIHSSRVLTRYRSLCSLLESTVNDNVDNEGARLQKLYRSWEDNPDIGFVMVKGRGRAFSAGGDIVALYHLVDQGNLEACKEFIRKIYGFIYLLGTYLKPHIFATPETLIGFHPDAGASFYLSHLPGHLGEYLGLTGEELNGVEIITCGLATHYTLSAVQLPLIEEQLGKLVTDDPSVIETTLEKYGDLVRPDSRSALQRIETSEKCFGQDTVEEIVDALASEASQTNDAWCIATPNRLKEASPLSLKVSLRSIGEGRFQALDQCLSREYHMLLQGISKQISGDFCEGVRARVVDEDMAPKYQLFTLYSRWDPPTLDKMSDDMVYQYFLPVSEFEPGLEPATKIREAYI